MDPPTGRPGRALAVAVWLLASLMTAATAAQAQRPSSPAAISDAPGWARPPAVAPVGGRVLRRFDPPATPYGRGHRGVDLAAMPGEQVRATLGGRIVFAGAVAGAVWVTVAHGGGLETTYGGLVPTVEVGDRVRVGSALGRATRRAWIDWGARHAGRYVDPLGLLAGWTVRLVPVRDPG